MLWRRGAWDASKEMLDAAFDFYDEAMRAYVVTHAPDAWGSVTGEYEY